jgi:hypothetical protein
MKMSNDKMAVCEFTHCSAVQCRRVEYSSSVKRNAIY